MTNFTVRYLFEEIVIEDDQSNLYTISSVETSDDEKYEQVIEHLESKGYYNIEQVDYDSDDLKLTADFSNVSVSTDKFEVISYINNAGDKITAIELKEKYSGYIVSFDDIEMPEVQSDNEDRLLNFTYNIHSMPEFFDDIDKDEFQDYLGNVLCDIIENGLKTNNLVYV